MQVLSLPTMPQAVDFPKYLTVQTKVHFCFPLPNFWQKFFQNRTKNYCIKSKKKKKSFSKRGAEWQKKVPHSEQFISLIFLNQQPMTSIDLPSPRPIRLELCLKWLDFIFNPFSVLEHFKKWVNFVTSTILVA